LKFIVVSSKPITIGTVERFSSRSLRLWKESREVLKGNERVKSGKVKLRTLDVGESGK